MRPISLYNPAPVACRPYDPRFPEVARRLGELIRGRAPEVEVEHVGSTSVPDCEGKGYIDLLVLYPEGALETAKAALSALGFQPQPSRDPFPEKRPMRVGSFTFEGQEYSIHAHVVWKHSAEADELLWFRERLRTDARLRAEYVAEKRRILTEGVTDQVDYCVSKGTFVEKALAARERAKGAL
ncbi:MAG TPA: GrpB family protein [Pyrinomonadaceae bacterium]|nr:GrpB family protein [Pyrinomonadaceae bacterium]